MTHLTLEQLLAVREPGLEPGVQGWRDHLEACEVCQAELGRLDQRVARLRALPMLKPARNRFLELQARARADRRRRIVLRSAFGALALAASIAIAVVVAPALRSPVAVAAGGQELEEARTRSRELEETLTEFNPERRVLDGRTALIAASLEDRLAQIDRRLEVVNLMEPAARGSESLRLWRERVGLLDALVDVHVTRAGYVGF